MIVETQIQTDLGEQVLPNLDRIIAIDQAIIQSIDNITQEERNFWSLPLEHDRRGYGHRFFQYPAMMVPVIQSKLIEIICREKPDTETLLDPFMGSGATLAAGMMNGLDCYGQDVNPLAVLLAKVKTQAFHFQYYREAIQTLFERITNDQSSDTVVGFTNITKWFTPVVTQELSKLVRAIRTEADLVTRRLYWVTLAETIRLTSNDRTSTFKLHARDIEEIHVRDVSPIRTFIQLINQNLNDVELQANQIRERGFLNEFQYIGEIGVRPYDSAQLIAPPSLEEEKYDLLVSSPPYGDNKTTVTYGQHAYLPLQWIDFADIDDRISRDCLRTTLQIDSNSLGGQLSKGTQEERLRLISMSPTLDMTLRAIERHKPSEQKKVVAFFSDLNKVLLNCLAKLKPNAYMVWTIGNRRVADIEVFNNLILQELLEHQGAQFIYKVERSIHNKRMAVRNQIAVTMSKEEILIFRKQ